jgi:hypothetical protein
MDRHVTDLVPSAGPVVLEQPSYHLLLLPLDLSLVRNGSLICLHTLNHFLCGQISSPLSVEVLFGGTALRKAAREPEVTHFGAAVRVQQNVCRLEVSVHDVGLMHEG